MGKKVAVVGATGNIGFPLTQSLLELGHEVLAVSRGRTEANASKLDELEERGARLSFQADLTDVAALSRSLDGYEVLVSAMRASPRTVAGVEPAILEAALAAGVTRLVPSEFGTHTMAVDFGVSAQFDAKKHFQQLLFESGLQWTIVYGGGIAEYFVPHLREGDKVTVYGDPQLAWPTHLLSDIGAVSARAVTDERTVDHAVQLWAHRVTSEQLIETLRQAWPDHPFDVEYISSEELELLLPQASTDPGSRRLSEREILGITYANFVLGQLGVVDHPGTLNANDLYPDYPYRDPLELLHDRSFVFG
jgi:uncharacterized protein YbjT (DUF2867 family)